MGQEGIRGAGEDQPSRGGGRVGSHRATCVAWVSSTGDQREGREGGRTGGAGASHALGAGEVHEVELAPCLDPRRHIRRRHHDRQHAWGGVGGGRRGGVGARREGRGPHIKQKPTVHVGIQTDLK